MNLSVLLKQALNHPSFEHKKKICLDFVESKTNNLREIMNTCNGRDKFLAIIQYSCGVKDNLQRVNGGYTAKGTNVRKAVDWDKVQEQLSSGRKVFRLLKWSDEIGNMIKHSRSTQKKEFFKEVLFYSGGICSFFYYFLDNIIWASSNRYKLLRRIKDLFSLSRCLIEIYKSLYEIATDLKREEKILRKLGLYDDCFIAETEESYHLIRELIKIRHQMSFYVLEFVTNVLRVFMLYKSLRFIGSDYMEEIFVNICGVLSNFFALFKTIKRKTYEKICQKEKEMSIRREEREEIVQEEEKKSNFLLFDEIISGDDSSLDEANGKLEKQVKKFNLGKITHQKSVTSSPKIEIEPSSDSTKPNSTLKHAKSTTDACITGTITELRKDA
ncbi:unnamed protein product [Moneuplotes crassus]|uniref:Uncharacterized protein n=1 Tax=Euplotes crassus TaxID=5936 RepID=A0AAD1UHI2_EUPCR|nr:unnamed protein product [Moneuplotes crassus]